MYEILALIPARGGSKGVPRKNVKILAGKPLIAWTIETALRASCINRVIVSTDDDEIAAVSREYGAEIPFIRPSKFASDAATDMPVYQHTLYWLEKNEGYKPEIVVWLRPTSPLRSSQDIDMAVIKLINTKADWVRSICLVGTHPYWVYQLGENDRLSPFVDGVLVEDFLQRQLLPDAYYLSGAVDATWRTTITEKKLLYSGDVRGYEMNAEKSLDIDSELDFSLAELLLEKRK